MITISVCLVTLCVCAKSFQLCLTLCDSMDCSPPGSSVYGILQGRILEGIAISSSRGSSWPTSLKSPALAGGFFTTNSTWEAPPAPHHCPIHPYKYRHYNSIYFFSVCYHIILTLPMKCPLSLSVFWHLNLASVRYNNPPCGLLDSFHRFSEAAFLCLFSVFSCHMLPWTAACPLATICSLTGVLLSIGFLPIY